VRVRLKRSTEGKARDSSTLTQALFGKESLWRGSPSRELELTPTYRLEVDIGGAGGKVPGRSLGGKMFFGSLKNDVAGQPRKVSS
jgi:hypothetical protein